MYVYLCIYVRMCMCICACACVYVHACMHFTHFFICISIIYLNDVNNKCNAYVCCQEVELWDIDEDGMLRTSFTIICSNSRQMVGSSNELIFYF